LPMRKAILLLSLLLIMGVAASGGNCAATETLVRHDPSLEKRLYPEAAGIRFALDDPRFLAGGSGSDQQDDFFQMPDEFEEEREGLKSASTAALLSLILPGAGEIYGGAETKGKIFMLSEASLWAGFFGFRTYSGWLKKDYKSYAADHARVDLDGKSDQFFDELAFYENRDQYNQFAPLYNRGEKQPYPQDDFWNWQWDSRESRLHYRDMKNRSKDLSRRALYMVGLSVVNRIVSVVDALKTVRSYNRKKSLELSKVKFDLQANPLGHNPTVMLYLSRRW
jgi:hypothetical protein